MGANEESQATGEENLEAHDTRKTQPAGLAWVTMLVWIGFAFLVAGLIAYRLVMPFFHHS